MAKKVLIIDDDKDLLEVLSFLISEDGYQVIASTTGEEVENLNENRPDLILLDLRLAGTSTSGAEICVKLKANQTTKDVPVILISAETDIKAVASNCGADDYIKKPFDIYEVSEKVKSFLYT
ncbi:MAG: response regulator [Sphingobacteriaceae bacterium]